MEGAVAAVLLLGGGLSALQTASITTGLPFSVLLLVMGYSLWKGLRKEYETERLRSKTVERESYQKLIERLLQQGAPPKKNQAADAADRQGRDDQTAESAGG
jgi:choline/glycine/proline betaine transport protein